MIATMEKREQINFASVPGLRERIMRVAKEHDSEFQDACRAAVLALVAADSETQQRMIASYLQAKTYAKSNPDRMLDEFKLAWEQAQMRDVGPQAARAFVESLATVLHGKAKTMTERESPR